MTAPVRPTSSCKETVDVLYGFFYLQDAGQDHAAGIQIEAWSSEPPRQESWEISEDFQVACTTGEIAPVGVTMGPSEEEIVIGPPGTYAGRVYSRGRQDTRRAREEAPSG